MRTDAPTDPSDPGAPDADTASARAPGRSRRGDALRTAGLTTGAIAGLTAAQVFYQGGTPSYRTIWAEDGQIYFYDAAHKGLASLATPYSGYLQVVTRLVALPATWVPVASLAAYLALAGALCASLAAVSIYWLADQAIPSRVLRVALVIAVALHPVLIVENIANITNMIWVLAFAVFWALLRRPVTTGAIVLGAAVAFAGSASTSLTVLYLPIAAYALWSRRERGTQIVVGAYGLGLVLQGITYLTTSEPGASSAAPHLPTLYLARVLGSVAVGDRWAAQLWDSGQRAHLFPFVALVIVVLGVLLAITRGRALIVGSVCLVYSVVTFVVVLVDRGAVGEQLTSRWNDNATRYDVLGVLFVLAAVFVLLGGAGPARRVRTVLAGVVALQLAVVIGFAYRHDNPRSGGPEWTSGLAAAKTECEARHLSEVNVPTSPGGVFMVQLPCHDLE